MEKSDKVNIKLVQISSCAECPHHIFDDKDNNAQERWGKSWCTHPDMDVELPELRLFIPDECPLPNGEWKEVLFQEPVKTPIWFLWRPTRRGQYFYFFNMHGETGCDEYQDFEWNKWDERYPFGVYETRKEAKEAFNRLKELYDMAKQTKEQI